VFPVKVGFIVPLLWRGCYSPPSQSSLENVLDRSNIADLHKFLKSKVSAPTKTPRTWSKFQN